MTPAPPTLDDTLTQTEWVRRLARSLVSDADADDLAQDALEASLSAPGPVSKGWLAGVLKNLAAFRHRSTSRRVRREASVPDVEPAPTPVEVLERLELQRLLTTLVAELPEPTRVVLYLRYFEGLDATAIGARLDLPPGTVRWRLKQGVDELRAQLDEREGGRERWSALLLPLAQADGSSLHLTTGALLMKLKHLVALAAAIILFFAGALFLWKSDAPPPAPVATPTPSAPTLALRATLPPAAEDVERAAGAVPTWLAQPGAPARRVAGHVTLDGKPIAGAVVTLSMDEQPTSTPPQERVTAADGTFDFGFQRPVAVGVGASLPGHPAVAVEVDLRDPEAAPKPETLELALTSGCPAQLKGRVLDSGAGPVVGARVHPGRTAGVASDANGAYELCLPLGESNLLVEAAGYGAMTLRVQLNGSMLRDIVLTPEATLHGIVVDTANAPVADAIVTASARMFQSDGMRSGVAHTDASGKFTMQVSPGDYRVSAVAAGSARSPIQVVSALVDGPGREVRLVVVGGVRVRGIVMSGSKPVSGARVTAHTVSTGRAVDAFSQADGRFVLDGVPEGALVFTAEPWAVERPRRWVAKAGAPEVTLEVQRMASVRGVVTRLKKPVAGAKVEVNSMMSEPKKVITDAKGRYEVLGLNKGNHQVVGSSDAAGAFTQKSLVIADREDVTLDLELDGAASIEGTVVDEKGQPLAGALVSWANSRYDTGQGTTDAQGHYRAAQMTGGDTYEAKVYLSGQPGSPAKPVAASLPSVVLKDGNSHAEGIKLQVKTEKLPLSGRVVDAKGQPVADVKLRAQAAGDDQFAMFSPWRALPQTFTDANGAFTFTGLSSGTWAIRARSPTAEESTVTAEAGKSDVLITLRPVAHLDGKLVGYQQTPVIYAQPVGGRFVAGQVTGDEFHLELPAGEWIVSAMDNQEGDVQKVTLKEGERTTITMHSRGMGKILGRVRDHETGQPVPNLICHPVLADGDSPGITNWDEASAPTSDQDGLVVVDPAPAGHVALGCLGDDVQSGSYGFVDVAAGKTVELTMEVVRRTQGSIGDPGLEFAALPTVIRLEAAGAAAKAGLLVGDRVIAIDGKPLGVVDGDGAFTLIANRGRGASVVVSADRGGQPVNVTLVLP